jgi:hypothetical protein
VGVDRAARQHIAGNDREGFRESRGHVKGSGVVVDELTCTRQLARFFSQVAAVRIPVQVTALRNAGSRLREATVVEFCGPEHAIFLSSLPLEFDDRVKLERDRSGRAAEAAVIAVQYHEGCKAVAVRFLQGARDWVTQP